MNGIRNIFFQLHLWTGLGLGLFFILLGLSGSVQVYPQVFGAGVPDAPAARTLGDPLPWEEIIAAARASSPRNANASATLTLNEPGEAASVRFANGRGGFGRGGRGAEGGRGAFAGRGALQGGRAAFAGGRGEGRGGMGRGAAGRGGASAEIFVDPVSGQVLETKAARPSALLGLAHRMHESMLLGRGGRQLVGWLGVVMLFLGLSGLYLWWPKSGQWKYAFIVRPNARGARLYREIHGAFGIWFLVVFLVVTATGLPLSFPGLLGGRPGPGVLPPMALPTPPPVATITVPEGAMRRPLAELVATAERSSNSKAVSITVPAQADRPVSVMFAREEDGPARSISINPYSGELLAGPAARRMGRPPSLSVRGLHEGNGLGPVWRALVFVSGFLPLLFVVTGLLMWWKKRRARAAVRTQPA